MKIISVSRFHSTEHNLALQTSPPISRDIENAFAAIVSSKPEWRSPSFRVSFFNEVVFISPPSAATPDFVKSLTMLLEEAEKAVQRKQGIAREQRAKEEYEKNSRTETTAKTLGLPIS